jgi:hypothetical protein
MIQQPRVVIVNWSAPERDPVGIIPGQLGEQPVQRLRMADLVLRERAEGNVLLEQGSDPGPLGVPEAEHELVVRHAAEQPGERVVGRLVESWAAGGACRSREAHPCSTPSRIAATT